MASSKKPVYLDAAMSYDAFYRPPAETKLVTERKRRHSDLVIMWHSIVGVTTIILYELWTTLLHMWQFLELWFTSSERFELQTWLEKYLPYVPDDFSTSWRDGRLLAILLNQLLPGCFPDARELDPDYGLRNVYKAFDVLETYFGIKPGISAEEVVVCIDGSDIKLFNILLELKRFTGRQPESRVPPELEPNDNLEATPSCIAKGTGLAVAFVGRITHFIIFCVFISDLDVIIEIKGPTTLCCERITKRSPKKKRFSTSSEFPRLLPRSTSMNIETDNLTSEDETLQKNISLEYDIIGNQISVGYRPKEKGHHRVSILWHGRHVSDSPYLVNVEDPVDVTAANQRKSVLKMPNGGEKNEMKKHSVRFEDTRMKYKEPAKHLGRVISRRILRYIVRVNGKDIPINAESTDSIASELLKMEYDIETCSSPHRRNSWGFTGDAERKRSVIRQFGIDVDELENQISTKRTRSLSAYPGSKKLQQKSDSLETLNSKLNIVNEVAFECNDNIYGNEADYAYLNEDSMLVNDKTKMNEVLEMEKSSKLEVELKTPRSFDDSSTNSLTESMKTKLHKISLLSTEDTQVYAVDNLNDDLQLDQLFTNLPNSSESFTSRTEPTVKISLNCEYSGKGLNNNDSNFDEYYYGIPKTAKFFCPICKNVKKKASARKYSQNNKKYIKKTKKGKKATKRVFLKKSQLSSKAIEVPIVTIRRKWHRVKRSVLERKHCSPLNIIKCLKNLDIVAFNSQKNYDTDRTLITKQTTSFTNLETTASLLKNNNLNQEIRSHFNEELSRIVKNKQKISNIHQPFENLLNEKQSKYVEEKHNDLSHLQNSSPNGDSNFKVNAKRKISNTRHPVTTILEIQQLKHNDKITKHDIQEPKINIVPTNNTVRPMLPSVQSKIKENAVKFETPKEFHTHTLKTIELLNLKQFSLPNDSQTSSSPVKNQITQWENNFLSDCQQSISRKTSTSTDIEQGSVKERLAFWENTNKTKNDIVHCVSETNSKNNLIESKKSCRSSESENNVTDNDLYNIPHTDKKQSMSASHIKRKEQRNSSNTEAAKKDMDHIKPPDFDLNDRRRSFSDPGGIETSTEQIWELPFLQSSESNKVCLNFSNDNNLELCFSDESDDFSGGCSQHSMSDGYIDDEISENASEYWGDLSHVKDLKGTRCSIDSSFWVTDFLQNQYQQIKSYPEQCKVFGIAVYYGYVAIKNRFQVYTGDSGFGNLSVSMQGFRRYDVSLVSVVYVRKDVYEVTYQVMTKGYYLISIRWMEKEIPGSPFVCKVTF